MFMNLGKATTSFILLVGGNFGIIVIKSFHSTHARYFLSRQF